VKGHEEGRPAGRPSPGVWEPDYQRR
jgi:hypothetical protein